MVLLVRESSNRFAAVRWKRTGLAVFAFRLKEDKFMKSFPAKNTGIRSCEKELLRLPWHKQNPSAEASEAGSIWRQVAAENPKTNEMS